MKPITQKYRRDYIEYLTAKELAQRLKVKPSWVRNQAKRADHPIPVQKIENLKKLKLRLKDQDRYAWGSAKLTDWLNRWQMEK